MADENIFDNTSTDPQNVVVPPNQPTLPDSVKDLVGPGKKYASVEIALEALAHSQNHIAKLEQEARERAAQLEQVMSVEKVHETVQELLKKERETHVPATVDEAALSGLLDRALTQREQAALAQKNQDAVVSALRAKYGDKAQEVYEGKANELGVSVADLNLMARKSSTAVLTYFDVKPVSGVPSRPGSTINTEAFVHNKPPVEKPKSPMYGEGSIKDSWEYAKQRVMNRLNQE